MSEFTDDQRERFLTALGLIYAACEDDEPGGIRLAHDVTTGDDAEFDAEEAAGRLLRQLRSLTTIAALLAQGWAQSEGIPADVLLRRFSAAFVADAVK